MLAFKAGPGLIRQLAGVTRQHRNPSMDGWMFEMWFFACIRKCGLRLIDKKNGEEITWSESNVEIIEIPHFPSLPSYRSIWLKPSKWNQGGFDAIYLDKMEGLVRFVQVTAGDTHSFKIEHFYKFLTALSISTEAFEVKEVQIYFVIEEKKKDDFNVQQPSIPGMLRDFGWASGTELEKVKVVSISGL